jgi:hypothetical protein
MRKNKPKVSASKAEMQDAFNKTEKKAPRLNRGEKMMVRGEKKAVRVAKRLEGFIAKKYEKPLAKQAKLKEKFGPKPTMGQANRIKKAGPSAINKRNYEMRRAGTGLTNPAIKDENIGFNITPIATKQLKINNAYKKVKKGEMLSENIKYRRSQKKG